MPLYRGSRRLILRGRPAAVAAASAFVAGTGVAIQNPGFAAGTLTFAGLNNSVNYPAGALVVVAFGNDQGTPDPTLPKIGTTSLTQAVSDSSTKCQLWYAVLAGSEVDTFTCTNGASYNVVGVQACYMTGVSTLGPTAVKNYPTGTNPVTPSTSPTIPANGFGVAMLWSHTTGGATPTWTNTTAGGGDISVSRSTTQQILMAHSATAGSWTPTVDSGLGAGVVAWNNACGMALATFS